MPNSERRSYLLEVLRVLLALACALIGITAAALIAESFGAKNSARVGRKFLVPLFFLGWMFLLRTSPRKLVHQLGFSSRSVLASTAIIGFVGGASSLFLLNVVLFLMGARIVEPELPPLQLLLRAVTALGQVLFLGLLEEALFQGLLLGRFMGVARKAFAVLTVALIFAGAHFLRPPEFWGRPSALDVAPACLAGLGEIATEKRVPEFVGLFFVGLVLSTLRAIAGHVGYGIGVHAGWVWVRIMANKSLGEVKSVVGGETIIFGTMRNYDGLLGWIALLATLGAVLFVLHRQRLAAKLLP